MRGHRGTQRPRFAPVTDDRAPGVTDTSVKVGVMYLDLSEAGPILGINQGDWQAAYTAAFDAVNEAGGGHQRPHARGGATRRSCRPAPTRAPRRAPR